LLWKENLFNRKERKEALRKRKENLKEKAASFRLQAASKAPKIENCTLN
jgi:hypothetical protein